MRESKALYPFVFGQQNLQAFIDEVLFGHGIDHIGILVPRKKLAIAGTGINERGFGLLGNLAEAGVQHFRV